MREKYGKRGMLAVHKAINRGRWEPDYLEMKSNSERRAEWRTVTINPRNDYGQNFQQVYESERTLHLYIC